MKYFKHEVSGNELHLYPFVCWHLGSHQSDIGFIERMVKKVKDDPLGRWVYMGDGGECALKNSKGDVYSATMNPTEQQNAIVELIAPIRDKGLFGIRGNHGNRVYKETGLDFDETLCAKLGIPYLGVAAYWHLVLRAGKSHPAIYSIYTHHGTDSGVSIGTKVVKGQAFDRTFIADAILTAHSHIAIDIPPRYYATLGRPREKTEPFVWNATYEYICGSAYDSRSGYAEDKGYPPLVPSHIMINFHTHAHDGVKMQSSEVYRKEDI